MNYFSLRLYFSFFIITSGCISGGYLLSMGYIPQACFLLLLSFIAVVYASNLISRLKSVMSYFLNALEALDTTVSFHFKGDPGLTPMSETMNRIMKLYHSDRIEIETKRNYYDRILKTMTHEIRNDLAPILSLSTDMCEHTESYSSAEMSEAMALIASQSKSLKKFLDSYYELTHIPTPEIKIVDVREFLTLFIKRMEISAYEKGLPKNIFSTTIPIGLKSSFDPALISRALSNIVKNAIEAIDPEKDPHISIIATSSDNKIIFTIRDNGNGMSKEAIDNVFMPFFSTKPSGSGIGMPLSRQIVTLHKGELSIKSFPGKGTSVSLILPRNIQYS